MEARVRGHGRGRPRGRPPGGRADDSDAEQSDDAADDRAEKDADADDQNEDRAKARRHRATGKERGAAWEAAAVPPRSPAFRREHVHLLVVLLRRALADDELEQAAKILTVVGRLQTRALPELVWKVPCQRWKRHCVTPRGSRMLI